MNGLRVYLEHHRWLVGLLVLGLLLRLVYGLSVDPLAPYQAAADTWWYLDHGYKLVTGTIAGPPPSAPLYLILPGIAQQLFGAGSAGAVIFLRIIQAVMGTATCYFVYRMARELRDERAGLLAMAVLVLSPVMMIESAALLTETLYIFLVSAGLAAYIDLVKQPDTAARAASTVLLVALLLALATLTRAVLLVFPLGLAIHLLMVYGWRRGLRLAAILLVVYTLVCSVWTIYNLVRWNYPVIGAQGLSAFLFIGAQGWAAPDQIDQNLAQESGGQLPTDPREQQQIYSSAAAQAITSDIPAWIGHRLSELAGAFLQPHGTTFFHGESLKNLLADWWTNDRTVSGLLRLTNGEQFWPKLAIYLFYYIGVLAGLVGLWITRRNWPVVLPLVGFILYTLLIHFLLDALPRYLFPLYIVWWAFAGVALLAAWDRLSAHRPAGVQGRPTVQKHLSQ